ncbi:MAG: type II toxin-antitoxin system VapC family toxin [Kiloniellales bacterium]|nr:type II toxin-antitoxin system VapC family toxin [Kiloniellales bacterium]
MVIDTSAIVAILCDETERRQFNERIVASRECWISAATLLEARIVLFTRFGEGAVVALDAFLLRSGIEVADVTTKSEEIAFDAYRKFGKGSGHPAGLKYGDCFSYALAKSLDAPLLFKGDDFSKTDIRSAVAI